MTHLKVNGIETATGAAGRYNVLSFAPRKYNLSATAFLYPDNHPLHIEARAGELIFLGEFWAFDGFILRPMEASVAKATMEKLSLAASGEVQVSPAVADLKDK